MKQIDFLKKRAQIIKSIREFFWEKGFIETDTPTLVSNPGMEPHIRPIRVRTDSTNQMTFLQTSPEFAMKKIMSMGFDNIFQICKSYRYEPKSNTHHPEFTMLEWYRTNSNYFEIMDDVEELFEFILSRLDLKVKSDIKRPWIRLRVLDAFKNYANIDLTSFPNNPSGILSFSEFLIQEGLISKAFVENNIQHSSFWDDLFFLVMLNKIEPALTHLGSPIILYDYPESQAALSNLYTDANGFVWAKRFEVYAGGFELGNAFDELTDPIEQQKRFEKDMQLRRSLYKDDDKMPTPPTDAAFLNAIKKLPPSGGIAMGVDRMIQYFLKEPDIQNILWQESYLD